MSNTNHTETKAMKTTIITRNDVGGDLLDSHILAQYGTGHTQDDDWNPLVSLAMNPQGDGMEVYDFRSEAEYRYPMADSLTAVRMFHSLCE